MTILKGVCECVTWTTIATFRQQCVKSPVNVILFSNVRFEAISLRTTKMRVFPNCVPTKNDKEKVRVSRDKVTKLSHKCTIILNVMCSNAQQLENMNQIQQVMYIFKEHCVLGVYEHWIVEYDVK